MSIECGWERRNNDSLVFAFILGHIPLLQEDYLTLANYLIAILGLLTIFMTLIKLNFLRKQ